MKISFIVSGKPTTQGSYRALKHKTTDKAIMLPMMSKAMREWRKTVAFAARAAMGAQRPSADCVKVSVTFVVSRPKRAKNAWPRGDTDKLQRALGDAMSSIVYLDDVQICEWSARKVFGSQPGAVVTVETLQAGLAEYAQQKGA